MSLGKFPDLLWMIVPESRPMIAERIREQLDQAIEYGLFLSELSNYELAGDVYTELISPALREMPKQRDLLVRCFMVIRRSIAEGGRGVDWEPIANSIMDRLEAGGWFELINQLDPELIALHRSMQSNG